jgi:hypothetical protein
MQNNKFKRIAPLSFPVQFADSLFKHIKILSFFLINHTFHTQLDTKIEEKKIEL